MKNLTYGDGHVWPCYISKSLFLAVIFSAALMGVAHADDDDNRGNHYGNNRNEHYRNRDSRQWREHQNYTRGYWNQRHYRPEPTVVYAPPAYYYPEPVYQSPGLNFIFPLHIR
ncbi:MAG: hypothetical protein K2Q32_02665 [Alphaproteobacteria bacterium]|nr:hypothetical protein [Alphaproteobacteria bacterium]